MFVLLELPGNEAPMIIEHFSKRVRTELITMAMWLQRAENSNQYKIDYQTARSDAIVKSLHGLVL